MDTSLRVRRRHRSWPEALKREIVAASLEPGASVSVVARHYDVNTNLVFTWRKRFGEAPTAVPAPRLVPIVVTPDQPAAALPPPSGDVIEIELPRLHPNLAEVYRQKVATLVDALASEDGAEARELVRGLVDRITLYPEGKSQRVEVRGELAAILALSQGAQSVRGAAAAPDLAMQIKMVAGTGFEPVTFRL